MVAENTTTTNVMGEEIICIAKRIDDFILKKDYDLLMICNFWDNFRVTDPLALGNYPDVAHIRARLDKNKALQEIAENQELHDLCIKYFREMVTSNKRFYCLTFYYHGFSDKLLEIHLLDGSFKIVEFSVSGGIHHDIDVIPEGKEVLTVAKTYNQA